MLVAAVDGRERLRLRVTDPAGHVLAESVITYPTVGERLSIPLAQLPPEFQVELLGSGPLHLCLGPDVAPQLIAAGPAPTQDQTRVALLGQHLGSAAARGLWGWMTGCVFDALDA